MQVMVAGANEDDEASGTKVHHPWIEGWKGEPSWSAPGEPMSEFVVFDTQGDSQPFRVTHDRDMMFDHGDCVQDYNFIDYFFGPEDQPIRCRHYLGDDHVSVFLPLEGVPKTSAEVTQRLPVDVLNYLRRRFQRVQVMMVDGYREIWPNPR